MFNYDMKKIKVFTIGLLGMLLAACSSSKQQTKNAEQPANEVQSKNAETGYKIAVVDLMILKRQKLGAFQLTKDIGADGVEVDMGGLGQRETFDNQLANDSIRQVFLNKAKELNLEIPSLAMTGFYAQSFPER